MNLNPEQQFVQLYWKLFDIMSKRNGERLVLDCRLVKSYCNGQWCQQTISLEKSQSSNVDGEKIQVFGDSTRSTKWNFVFSFVFRQCYIKQQNID